MQHSEAVAAAIERFCEHFTRADLDGFRSAVADDAEAFVIGTQRWTTGREQWMANFRALVDNAVVLPDGSGARVEPADVRGYAEGAFG